jgi:serine protease
MNHNFRNLCAGALGTAILVAIAANAAPATPASAHKAAAARTLPRLKSLPAKPVAPVGFDRYIVKYDSAASSGRSASTLVDKLDAAARRALVSTATAGQRAPAAVSFEHVRKLGVGADVVRASRRLSREESSAFLAQLRAEAGVKYAQPDYVKQRLDTTPNDPQFSTLQWDYTDATGGIKAPTAWDTSSGEGVVVAVLDTGYTDHRDLVDNIVPGYDFISYYGQETDEGLYPDVAGDGDGRDDDAHDPGDWTDSSMNEWCGLVQSSSWHGTHVAGTVAAVTNNAQDVAGVAYGARVQPVRVLGHCGGVTSDIADGIVWASGGHVDGIADNPNPAEVINMSLGGSGKCEDDPATQEAIDGAISRGVTVVVAAGNDGDDAAYYSPASCKGVVTVGATGINGGKSWFSNYGATVTLAAPGGDATTGSDPDNRWIWSTGNAGTTVPTTDVLMGFIGTSQASPHVAGTVALMQSAAIAAGKPALTPAQVKQILRSTARPFVVTPPTSTPMGAGVLDAAAATLAATQDVGDEDAAVLVNRVATTAQTGAAGDELLYRIDVPAGTRSLNLRSYGGAGNVSLYMAFDSVPTSTVFDRKSAKPGNSEAVVVTNPQAGTYYLRMVGEAAFANVSVMGLYQ